MAAGSTYTPIQTYTANGSSGVITFSSIPSTYTDIQLVMAAQNSDNYCVMRLNGDSSALYSRTTLLGNGSSASSGRGSGETAWYPSNGSSTVTANAIINIMNYSNTTTFKTALSRMNQSFDATYAAVWLYRSTSAISSITLTAPTGNWVSGSTFTLYGIAAA
jgi:hypothetical protein